MVVSVRIVVLQLKQSGAANLALIFAIVGPCLTLGVHGVLLPLLRFFLAYRLGFFSLLRALPGLLHQWVLQALGGVGPYVSLDVLPPGDEVVGWRFQGESASCR